MQLCFRFQIQCDACNPYNACSQKAARNVGISLWEMVDVLAKEGVYFDYDREAIGRTWSPSGGKRLAVVSNSTPLIFLSKIGKIQYLRELFDTVIIPNNPTPLSLKQNQS